MALDRYLNNLYFCSGLRKESNTYQKIYLEELEI